MHLPISVSPVVAPSFSGLNSSGRGYIYFIVGGQAGADGGSTIQLIFQDGRSSIFLRSEPAHVGKRIFDHQPGTISNGYRLFLYFVLRKQIPFTRNRWIPSPRDNGSGLPRHENAVLGAH